MNQIFGGKIKATHHISQVILRRDGVLVVLHLFNESLVEAEAIDIILGHERFQDEPQTALQAHQLIHVLRTRELGQVSEKRDGEHKHVIGHNVGQLTRGLFA